MKNAENLGAVTHTQDLCNLTLQSSVVFHTQNNKNKTR